MLLRIDRAHLIAHVCRPRLGLFLPVVFGMALPGSMVAGDPSANDRQRSSALAAIQQLAIASDLTVLMAPEVPIETRRLARRQLWRLFGSESDRLGDHEAVETVRPATAADDPVLARLEARR